MDVYIYMGLIALVADTLALLHRALLYRYVPYTDDKAELTACGVKQVYNASKEWADKKVVLFAVPGTYGATTTVSDIYTCVPTSWIGTWMRTDLLGVAI